MKSFASSESRFYFHRSYALPYSIADEQYQGHFRSSLQSPQDLFCATKTCIFNPIVVTKETMAANITQRVTRLKTEKIDLLQFHWQDVSIRTTSRLVPSSHYDN